MSATQDYFRQEKFLRDEEAQFVIAAMIGININEVIAAEKEGNLAKVAELEAIGKEYSKIRQAIYGGDENAKTRCIEEFGPILQNKWGK